MKTNQDTNRDSFVLYKSFYNPIVGFTDEQLGRLFRAIFRWQIDGTVTTDPDGAVNVAVAFIINQFRIDNDKYLERCETNRTNAKIRWERAKNATASDCIRPYANGCETMQTMPNDNDNDNDNDNENDNDMLRGPGGKPPARKTRKSFVKPSLDDVAAYCRERNNGIDPAAFIDHYDANGWMVGKNRMRDWKAAIRNWERTRHEKPTDQVNQATGKVITDIGDLFKD